MTPDSVDTEDDPVSDYLAPREDGRYLCDEWLSSKLNQEKEAAFIRNRTELMQIDESQIDYLMGKLLSDLRNRRLSLKWEKLLYICHCSLKKWFLLLIASMLSMKYNLCMIKYEQLDGRKSVIKTFFNRAFIIIICNYTCI